MPNELLYMNQVPATEVCELAYCPPPVAAAFGCRSSFAQTVPNRQTALFDDHYGGDVRVTRSLTRLFAYGLSFVSAACLVSGLVVWMKGWY